jgi:transcription-repair coupling factor (superfamily II helicase)
LIDRFGKIPIEVEHLLDVIKVKILLTRLSIRKLEERPSQMVLTFDEATKVPPRKVVELVQRGEGHYQMTPDSRLIVEGWPSLRQDPFGAQTIASLSLIC